MLTIILFYIGVSKRVNISTDFSVNLNFGVENKSRKVQLQVDPRSLEYKLFTSEVNVLSLEAYGGFFSLQGNVHSWQQVVDPLIN